MKAIFVSNSPIVLEKKLGSIIDTYDIVIRCNNFEIEGYEEYVGTKTDIWSTITGGSISMKSNPKYPIRSWMAYHKNKLKPFTEIWTVREETGSNLFKDTSDLLAHFENKDTIHRFLHKKLNNEKKLEYVSKFIEDNCNKLTKISGPKNKRYAAPGTGFLTILNAIELFGELTLYGNSFFMDDVSVNSGNKLGKHYFTMDIEKYKDTPRYSYFKNEIIREQTAKVLDYTTENKIVNQFIKDGRIKILK